MMETEKKQIENIGSENQETDIQRKERLRREIPELESRLDGVKIRLRLLGKELQNDNLPEKESEQLMAEVEELSLERHRITDELEVKRKEEGQLLAEMEQNKPFDKYALFRNIRELLKTRDVKLGQIEKDAGLAPGYMSRLDKPKNSSEPTLGFVIAAAKDLGVSVDYLINCEISSMTSTELYTYRFLDRLKLDTIRGKLLWVPETVKYSDSGNIKVMHPLLSLNKDFKNSSLVRKYVFDSHSFGADTIVDENCYSADIGEGTRLYIMNISK